MSDKIGTKVTERDFDFIKKGLEMNIPFKVISNTMKRSLTVIKLIEKCATWKDYEKFKAERVIKATLNPKSPKSKSDLTKFTITNLTFGNLDDKPMLFGTRTEDFVPMYYTAKGWKEFNV